MKLAVDWRTPIRKALGALGYDIIPTWQTPRRSLAGLSSLPIRTVVDVGANEGQFGRYIRGIFPDVDLYCFEPLPAARAALEPWARAQPGRVEVLPFAVGSESGTTTMNLHVDHTEASSLLSSTDKCTELYPKTERRESIEVEVVTLDQALASYELADDVLVKLDVQGFEDRVIAGGQDILGRSRLCIVEISLDVLYEGQARFRPLVDQLGDLGFRYRGNLEQFHARDGHVVFVDAIFSRD